MPNPSELEREEGGNLHEAENRVIDNWFESKSPEDKRSIVRPRYLQEFPTPADKRRAAELFQDAEPGDD